MDPTVSLVRRWAVDWLAGAHADVCDEILAPEYQITIGGFVLGPRDTYVAGTLEQLGRFPGLGLTIHELICSGEHVAVRFTEHGAAASLDGRRAAWSGVALFRAAGGRLAECWAEENYLGRRRQLDDAQPDPVESPAVAPWNEISVSSDPEAEETVRTWLAAGRFTGVELDDGPLGHPVAVHLADADVTIDALFSSGSQVAFHGTQTGRYAGGLDGIDGADGQLADQHLAGLVTVAGGEVVAGRVIRDRLGLRRALASTVSG